MGTGKEMKWNRSFSYNKKKRQRLDSSFNIQGMFLNEMSLQTVEKKFFSAKETRAR